MNLVLADTSAWSRFLRNDFSNTDAVVSALSDQLAKPGVVTTGVVYLELLRGFTKAETRVQIEALFDNVPFIEPIRSDYSAAADRSITCRRAGVQLGTIDSLIAQICIANDLTLLTADTDFTHAARHIPLDVWSPT